MGGDHQAGPLRRPSEGPGGAVPEQGVVQPTPSSSPDPPYPPLLASRLLQGSAAPGRVRVPVHRSPAAPVLRQQQQGQPGGHQQPRPLPWPRRGALRLLVLPLLSVLLQWHLPAPCGWGLHRESRDREGSRRPAAPGARAQCGRAVPEQAFSAFFYTVDFLSSVMRLPVATPQQLETAAVTVCNQTWSEVRPAPLPPGLGSASRPASQAFVAWKMGGLGLSEGPVW